MKRFVAYFFTFASICLFIEGCGPYQPNYIPLGLHDMTPINSSQPINLVNAQKGKNVHAETTVKTDLTVWSDQAIKLIKDWFDNNNIKVSENAQKYLNVSISEAYIDPKNPICTIVKLDIETSTGLQREYPSRVCAGGFSPNRSAGYAVNYAVVDLMHDGSILKYLSD